MASLLHIRVGKEIKNKMETLIDAGLFENQAEIVRESIRTLLLRYSTDLELEEKRQEIRKLEKEIMNKNG